ncbi:hypothetical protein KR032_007968 [Drosophila birchii]|nr:hypothetical protein KR032_007968 [Drosophila birchii]
MNDLKRRPLHAKRPSTPSEPEEQVDNRTLISESGGGYEEGTSSSGEQETRDDETPPATPPGTPAAPADRSRRQSLPPFSPESRQQYKDERLPTEPSSNGLYYVAAFAGILVGCYFAFAVARAPELEGFKTCSFTSLRNVQPKQPDKVWLALQKGIEGLINKKDAHPSVFLFLHQNPKLQKLIDAIASEASECYGGPSQLIHMSKEDFGPGLDNYGLAIERFKAKVKDGKVFLIVNLNEIAPNGARALHTICDTYSPIVEDAVIFLTLRTFNTTAARNSVALATDTLYDLWSKELSDNELDPLITRVTDQVLHLNS